MNLLKRPTALVALAASCLLAVSAARAGSAAIPNFHQVNERIYRGGQPEPQAWPVLAKMGIKAIIDLRRVDEHDTAAESKAVSAAGMTYINIPMKGYATPSEDQITRALAALNSDEPVFVHCRKGVDRTGTVIACYRIAHDRWEAGRALDEAKSLGMGFAQFSLKKYVMAFRPPAATPVASVNIP